LTVTPPDYVAALSRFPNVLNGRVLDISKRKVSARLVTQGDGYQGPVIVKPDLNAGGIREAQLALAGKPLEPAAARELQSYLAFRSPNGVPSNYWSDPRFVVERFVTEQRDGYYCLRTWLFFGDRETNSVSLSRSPIIKSSAVIRRESVPEVPDDLRRLRAELGFDFGKFDYVLSEGKAVLFDANRTPSLGHFDRETFLPRLKHLADGIQGFLT
jgi:hypothetical protein